MPRVKKNSDLEDIQIREMTDRMDKAKARRGDIRLPDDEGLELLNTNEYKSSATTFDDLDEIKSIGDDMGEVEAISTNKSKTARLNDILKNREDELVERISRQAEDIILRSPDIKSTNLRVQDRVNIRNAISDAIKSRKITGEDLVGGKRLRSALNKVFREIPMIGGMIGIGSALMSGDANALEQEVVDTATDLIGGVEGVGLGGKDEDIRRAIEEPGSQEFKSIDDLRRAGDKMFIEDKPKRYNIM